MGLTEDMQGLFEQNIYLFVGFVGTFISMIVFIISGALMTIMDSVFRGYIGKHDKNLWTQYNNFCPKERGRILKFIRIMPYTEDEEIKKIRRRIFIFEKVAMFAVLMLVVFFAFTIIAGVILKGK